MQRLIVIGCSVATALWIGGCSSAGTHGSSQGPASAAATPTPWRPNISDFNPDLSLIVSGGALGEIGPDLTVKYRNIRGLVPTSQLVFLIDTGDMLSKSMDQADVPGKVEDFAQAGVKMAAPGETDLIPLLKWLRQSPDDFHHSSIKWTSCNIMKNSVERWFDPYEDVQVGTHKITIIAAFDPSLVTAAVAHRQKFSIADAVTSLTDEAKAARTRGSERVVALLHGYESWIEDVTDQTASLVDVVFSSHNTQSLEEPRWTHGVPIFTLGAGIDHAEVFNWALSGARDAAGQVPSIDVRQRSRWRQLIKDLTNQQDIPEEDKKARLITLQNLIKDDSRPKDLWLVKVSHDQVGISKDNLGVPYNADEGDPELKPTSGH